MIAPLMACTQRSSVEKSMPVSVLSLVKSRPAAPNAAAAPTAAPTPGMRDPATPRTPISGARSPSTSLEMNFWVMELVSRERGVM